MTQTPAESLLVVDDAPNTLELLQRNLTLENYRVFVASSVAEAVRILEDTRVDLVITDLKMPGVGGLELIRYIRENLKETEVLAITGYPTVEGAVEAVKTGADNYLAKPFTDEELFSVVRLALGKIQMRRKARGLPPPRKASYEGLIGQSAAMQKVYRAVEKAASTTANVLVTGESGTGKELVARAIHYTSPRAKAPFLPVSCGAIPEGLLESELFGYVKGAFTGATETRAGFFQAAHGGTIFLDDINDTPLAMQVKLLRVLQEREVYMVGTTRSKRVDVRILAATNKNLIDLVSRKLFREDLFYRLNVISIEMPPLRDRRDDVLLLARHFADRFSAEMGKEAPGFSHQALELLSNYSWPGNVRELENMIQRLVVMTEEDVVDIPDFPSHLRYSLTATDLSRTLADVEAEHIRNVLAGVGGNKTRAAKILGIDRKTLRERIKK